MENSNIFFRQKKKKKKVSQQHSLRALALGYLFPILKLNSLQFRFHVLLETFSPEQVYDSITKVSR